MCRNGHRPMVNLHCLWRQIPMCKSPTTVRASPGLIGLDRQRPAAYQIRVHHFGAIKTLHRRSICTAVVGGAQYPCRARQYPVTVAIFALANPRADRYLGVGPDFRVGHWQRVQRYQGTSNTKLDDRNACRFKRLPIHKRGYRVGGSCRVSAI